MKLQVENNIIKQPIDMKKSEWNGGKTPPEQPAINSGANKEAILRELAPADRKAYYSYCWVENKMQTQVTDQQAYQWLKENGLPDEKDFPELAVEFNDYNLPVFSTWTRQLRKARKELRQQKYGSRAARTSGGSIVREREIEHQQDEDQ
ncbi:MAG: hypothetical protein ABSG67_18375 [Thermoguttaceae bacterium]